MVSYPNSGDVVLRDYIEKVTGIKT